MSNGFIQQNDQYYANGGGAASQTLAYGSNNTANNLLVAVVFWITAGVNTTVTDTAGNNWSSLSSVVISAGKFVQLFYAPKCKSGANTVKATFSSTGGTFVAMSIAEYSGVNTLDKQASAAGSSTSASSGATPTTNHAIELVLGYISAANSGITVTPGSGFTIRDTNVTWTAIEDLVTSSTGAQTATFGLNSTNEWGAGVATFYQLSGGGISTTQKSAPIATTVVNSKGQSIPITSPTLGSEIAAPTPVCFCDPNGNEYTVTGGTVGSEIAAPIPVVLCDGNGKPIVPPIVFTSNGNSYTISSTLTGTKLGQPTPVRLVNSSGFLYVVAGGGFTLGTFVASETSIVLCDTAGHEIISVGLAI